MRKLLSAALALTACVLMVAATAAFAARAETKVTIKAESGGFFGYVKSEKNKCANGRKVTLYKLKGKTRMHLLLKCPELEPVLPGIRRVAGTFPNDNNLSVILDVDPINMM